MNTALPGHMRMWLADHESDIGAMLKHYRLARGIPRIQLADTARLTQRAIGLIETQQCRPYARTLTRIATAYGMSLPSFLQVIWTEYQERCI